jgi:hypothetical protein
VLLGDGFEQTDDAPYGGRINRLGAVEAVVQTSHRPAADGGQDLVALVRRQRQRVR